VHKEHIPTRFLPELKLASRPALLALATLLLVGPGAVLKYWQTRPPAKSAGFDLPTGAPSLKLDDTSAETLGSQPAPAFEGKVDETNASPVEPIAAIQGENVSPSQNAPAPAPTSAGNLQLPDLAGPYKIPDPAAEPPKLEIANEPSAPQVFEEETFRYSPRGETPMIRNWKMLGLQTVLAAALAASPNPTYAQEGSEGKKNSDEKAGPSLKDLKKSLDSIQKDVEKISAMAEDIKKLNERVDRLQKELDDSRKRSTSFYAPTQPPTGRIRLVNTFPGEMRIVLNSIVYPLAPQETRDVPVPAGRFAYEVLNIQGFGTRTRDILANETFTITVHPQ
jgi:hypothetical protein